jgi:hypothetical protein
MKQLAQIIVPGGAFGFGFAMKSAAFCFKLVLQSSANWRPNDK